MSGRTALVTGASRGIGRALALELGERGYRTVLLARDEVALEETARMVKDTAGPTPGIEVVDVTDATALEAALTHATAGFGGWLDLLVNNAGSALRSARIEELTEVDWQAALDLNLMAAVRTTRHCFPLLREARGCVVNVSSVVAGRASPTCATYVVAKAALDGLTRSVALEWARHGIRCFAVAPGYVDTDFNAAMVEAGIRETFLKKVPTRSAIRPAEVARLIADLADPAHHQLNGAVVPLDGGLHVTL